MSLRKLGIEGLPQAWDVTCVDPLAPLRLACGSFHSGFAQWRMDAERRKQRSTAPWKADSASSQLAWKPLDPELDPDPEPDPDHYVNEDNFTE